MRHRGLIGLGAALAVAAGIWAAAGSGASQAAGPGLKPFASCGQLLGHVKQRLLPLVGPYGLPGSGAAREAIGGAVPAAGPSSGPVAGVDFSTTNVQEAGVDEPDLVKSDGSYLYVVRQDRLLAVDVRADRPRLVGSLALTEGWSHVLLLHGSRLFVLSQGGGPSPLPIGGGTGVARSEIAPYAQQTVLTEIDATRPSALTTVRSLVLDANYLSARLVGATARIVTVSAMPGSLRFPPPADGTAAAQEAAQARNRKLVASSRIGTWLPRYAVRGKRGQTLSRNTLVSCRDVRRPTTYSGTGLLTVLTIDLRKGLAPVDSEAVLADGQTVYASQNSLYVATQRWLAQPVQTNGNPPRMTTSIHRFDISDPLRTHYRSSGAVSGYVLNQWALSEYKNVLRVASTEEPTWWNPGPQQESESFVTTLHERAGTLERLGRVGGLGKGERVYSVRFDQDRAYVVTFRQVDPLYTLDLADAAKPVVLGELKIAGYSAYLHPLGGDLLLGVGQDASSEGRTLGTQLSVFDVSDLRRPTRLHRLTLGPGASDVEWDHHAFLWWPRERLTVLPVNEYALKEGGPAPFTGAIGFRITRAGVIEELGRITHRPQNGGSANPRVGSMPIRRSLIVSSTLYTVSDAGVQATNLQSFDDGGWAAFPPVGGP